MGWATPVFFTLTRFKISNTPIVGGARLKGSQESISYPYIALSGPGSPNNPRPITKRAPPGARDGLGLVWMP